VEAHFVNHAINVNEFFLLPLILVVHVVCAVVIARIAALRSPDDPKLGRYVLWGAIISLPAIFVAFVFDELLFMQIPW
jgi:hypothetical protein